MTSRARRASGWRRGGGTLTEADLAGYEAIAREPIRVGYRGYDVFTNPPPSAGGILIASVLAQLDREPAPPTQGRLVAAMEEAHRARTPEFMEGLDRPGFLDEFMASQLGSTTHISVLDGDGRACAVTCTNGEGSGIIVPGTGVHLNNMMGEEDLSPLGFFTHPVGRRLPSMMAPTVVARDGAVHVALGSAGSNRIRSAILQVILGVIDRGLDLVDAVEAPRVHWEDGVVYAEPGVDADALAAAGRKLAPFKDLNVFFGGAQAVRRDPATGELRGRGRPAPRRRGRHGVSGAVESRTTSSVGSVTSAGVPPAIASSSIRPAARPLSTSGWRIVVSAARGRGGHVVEADDRELARARRGRRRGRAVDRADRDLVGHGEERRSGRGSSASSAPIASAPERARVRVTLVDRHRRPSRAPAAVDRVGVARAGARASRGRWRRRGGAASTKPMWSSSRSRSEATAEAPVAEVERGAARPRGRRRGRRS